MAKVINRVIVKAQGVDFDEIVDEITDNVNGIDRRRRGRGLNEWIAIYY